MLRIVNKEKRVAKKIQELLNKRGFIIEMKAAKHSNSIYLIVDNGACGVIRISDHKNKTTKCKFNMIKDYQGMAKFYNGEMIKLFYNFKSIGKLIADVEIERSNRIIRSGYDSYRKVRDKKFSVNNYAYCEKKVA